MVAAACEKRDKEEPGGKQLVQGDDLFCRMRLKCVL